MRAAQEEARRATLAEQAVFSKYEEEVTAHWWAKSEKAKAVEACKSANQAKDLDLKRVEQEKDLRHRAKEEKAEHLTAVEQASRQGSRRPLRERSVIRLAWLKKPHKRPLASAHYCRWRRSEWGHLRRSLQPSGRKALPKRSLLRSLLPASQVRAPGV
jgi:hypothetical protein